MKSTVRPKTGRQHQALSGFNVLSGAAVLGGVSLATTLSPWPSLVHGANLLKIKTLSTIVGLHPQSFADEVRHRRSRYIARTVLTYALAGVSGANFSPAVTLAT